MTYDDERPTTVEAAPEPELAREAERRFNRELRKARERANWAAFGTIGFDAYKAWILENESKRGRS